MSLDFYFYVETRRNGVWNRPEEFALAEQSPHSHKKYGEFTWVHRSVDVASLFFSEQAIFKFRRERPPETAHSALFQHLDRFYDYAADEARLAWIPYEELFIDFWDEPSLLMQSHIAPKFAALFTDGGQLFPEQALREAGLKEYEMDMIRTGKIVATPIDRSSGRGCYESKESLPDRTLAVTWKDSVRQLLGQGRADTFLALQQYGQDDQLRVISLYW